MAHSSKSARLPRTYIIALIDELPPSTLPRGTKRRRLSMRGFGSVSYAQSQLDLKSLDQATGVVISRRRWSRPASISRTRASGSDDRRLAITHPDDPAPTTMKSYIGLPPQLDSTRKRARSLCAEPGAGSNDGEAFVRSGGN